MLYETVFTSAAESAKVRDAATLKTNSQGQVDLEGNELPREYVHRVSSGNEKLFEAVVAGTAANRRKRP